MAFIIFFWLGSSPACLAAQNQNEVIYDKQNRRIEKKWNSQREKVTFLDQALEKIVRRELGIEKEDSVLTRYVLESLTKLGSSVPNYTKDTAEETIHSLSDLKWLPNLEELVLENRGLENLEGIEELDKLRVLCVRGNLIEDISPVSALKNLEELDLSYNRITDIDILWKSSKLKAVLLNGNPIKQEELVRYFENQDNDYSIWEEQKKLSSDIPELIFQTANIIRKDDDEIWAIPDGVGDIQGERLTILDAKTKERINDIYIPAIYEFGRAPEISSLEYIDMNFDGDIDVRIYVGMNGNYRQEYIYLIWDKNKKNFYVNSALTYLTNPVFDQENKLVYSTTRDGCCRHYGVTYHYDEKEQLKAVESYSDEAVFLNEEQFMDIQEIFLNEEQFIDIQEFQRFLDKKDHIDYISHEQTWIHNENEEAELKEDFYRIVVYDSQEGKSKLLGEYDINSEIGKKITSILEENR